MFKKHLLNLTILDYQPISNILFLGKVLERMVVSQLQRFLDEVDYLDPFQSGFRPDYGTEIALDTLGDDRCWELDMGSLSLLILLEVWQNLV